jgi:hypothetical protein
MNERPDIDIWDEPSSEPLYLVEPHEGGGILIRFLDGSASGNVNLFSLDQVLAILAERLPQSYPVVLGGDV